MLPKVSGFFSFRQNLQFKDQSKYGVKILIDHCVCNCNQLPELITSNWNQEFYRIWTFFQFLTTIKIKYMIYMYFLQENYLFEIKRCGILFFTFPKGIKFTFKELIFSCKMFIFKDIFLINYMQVRHIESKNNLCSYSFSAIYVIRYICILLYCN